MELVDHKKMEFGLERSERTKFRLERTKPFTFFLIPKGLGSILLQLSKGEIYEIRRKSDLTIAF